MGRELFLLLFFFGISNAYNAKNVDLTSVIHLKNSGDNNLFGHSVAVPSGNARKRYVYVGAPLDDTHGNVFGCWIDGADLRKQKIDCNDKATVGGMTFTNNRNLFGMTVTAMDGKVVSCAPFEPISNPEPTNQYLFGGKYPYFSLLGKCYENVANRMQFQDMFEFMTHKYWCFMEKNYGASKQKQDCRTRKLEPYGDKWATVSIMGTHHIQTPKGVVFNAPYARRESTSKMIGTIVLKENNRNDFEVAEGKWYETKRFSEGKLALIINKNGKRYTYTQEYLDDPHQMDQTGAAFAKGHFYSFNQHLEHFVVGAPKANNLQGVAYICHDCFGPNSKNNGRVLQPPKRQRGERFGAAVATVDINGDGFDDVVVGAPLHSTKELADVGRIVVFKNSKKGKSNFFYIDIKEVLPKELKENSRFGFSVANIGDIHKDDMEDFAVGAPGAGAVFIFHGCIEFNFENYQKINAEDFQFPINSGFGYSLSKEISDVDSNEFKDIAVGAPFGGSAVILRSRPVIDFRTKVWFEAPTDISPEQNKTTIKLKIKSKRWTYYIPDVYATIDLDFDKRIKRSSRSERVKITKTNDVTFPDSPITKTINLEFEAVEDKFGMRDDQPKPIKISAHVTFEEIECQRGQSKLKCPMLSPNVNAKCINCKQDTRIELKTGCADKDACKCDLNFSLDKKSANEIIVGKTKSIDLAFKINNQGTEPAFGVTLVFASKVDFSLIQGPRGLCTKLGIVPQGQLFGTECNLRKVKANNETLSTFKFNLPKNFDGANDFSIEATLKSTCNGKPNKTIFDDELNFDLEYKTDFKVTSVVSESQIMYNKDKIDFVHTYTFINQGPSYTNEDKIVKLFFAKSKFTKLKYANIAGCEKEDDVSVDMENPILNEENPIGCGKRGPCTVFQCTIPEHWEIGQPYDFVLKAEFHPKNVTDLEHTEFSIYSMASIGQTKTHALTKMSSNTQGDIERLAANWPIVLGVGIGLFVVLGTILILWKTGMLAKMRPYKLDEEEVKREHRKSKMRLSVIDEIEME